jgi:hypothetical protein
MRKNKSKNKFKRSVILETQKQAFIKGCQESSLNVSDYAEANKISAASLYRWAEIAGVSLKSRKRTKSKINQINSTFPKAKSYTGLKGLWALKELINSMARYLRQRLICKT